MAKIMLVEDDTNLSEIYQARLTAEGYDIVSAHDGEEALALAAKEKPDLIISDVMMPKISGFEMLDILRNTEGLKEAKVIMLTALGQADDKTRADALGADRYLVKSQVTLEDIVKAAQELLTGSSDAPAAAPAAAGTAVTTPVMTPAAAPTPMAVAAPPVAPTPVAVAPTPAPVVPVAAPVAPVPVAEPALAPAPAAPVAPAPTVPIAAPILQPAPVIPPAPAPVAMPAATPVSVPVAAPTPAPLADPVPAPPVDPTATADNKLVADAVDDLMEGLTNKTGPAPVEAPAPTPTPTPDPVGETDPSSDESDDSSSNGGGSHKKIIKPISDDANAPKPSLESLLADEERKNPGATAAPAPNAHVTEVPHQPGHIITPSAAESLNNGSGIDPNSIAL